MLLDVFDHLSHLQVRLLLIQQMQQVLWVLLGGIIKVLEDIFRKCLWMLLIILELEEQHQAFLYMRWFLIEVLLCRYLQDIRCLWCKGILTRSMVLHLQPCSRCSLVVQIQHRFLLLCLPFLRYRCTCPNYHRFCLLNHSGMFPHNLILRLSLSFLQR